VRALVDDQRPRAERRRALDELASPRVEQRQQVRALDPRTAARRRSASAPSVLSSTSWSSAPRSQALSAW
jgi:hypothetical protein